MKMRSLFALTLALAASGLAAPPIATKTQGMTRQDGFLPLWWDDAQGKLWMEIPRFGQEFLYYTSLPAGVGSNDIGLDRGQLGPRRVVRFDRIGPKVLLVEPNYDFRAISNDAAERRAVRDSFAESVLWGFKVEAEDAGRVLVDATDFFLRDAHNMGDVLQRTRQGTYRVDPSRSALFLERTKAFPRNTEVEATLTFTGGPAGGFLRSVTPTADAVTVRQHHSFVELPPPGYEPRVFDPRGGFNSMSYMDYATPISESITKRFIMRHRPPKSKPIVYYLDRGAPEPIRSALLEGARWWNQAFEAAGFPNGFQVELMPEGADPMDLRYNVIQWVHRLTRGWSYGASVYDPRTGEILKGHVTLGSLRVRQDFLIAEAFLGPYDETKPANPAMQKMALDRLRELSAHEVGHTLGLSHNYIASAANRSSVMDYPHPWIELDASGNPDFSKAYVDRIGEWDKVAIRWGYGDNPQGILDEARKRGLIFLTDQDGRPAGSPHPLTHLWDSGSNSVDELNRFMKLRARALDKFSEKQIKPGVPLALLHDTLVPLYLSHRYQVEAAVKTVGGLNYTYALRGDGQKPTELVPAAEQRRALDALLATLQPSVLNLPESVLAIIPPRPSGYPPTRELFGSRTGLAFDALAPAEAAAHMVFGLLLHPERAARLVEHHARDKQQPALEEVLDRVIKATFKAPQGDGMTAQVNATVEMAALAHIMALANSDQAPGMVKAIASAKLTEVKSWLKTVPGAVPQWLVGQISAFEKDPKSVELPKPLETPPGMPI